MHSFCVADEWQLRGKFLLGLGKPSIYVEVESCLHRATWPMLSPICPRSSTGDCESEHLNLTREIRTIDVTRSTYGGHRIWLVTDKFVHLVQVSETIPRLSYRRFE